MSLLVGSLEELMRDHGKTIKMGRFTLLVALAIAAFPAATVGQQIASPKLRLSVGQLSDAQFSGATSFNSGGSSTRIEIPPPEDFALGLTEMLTTALVETGRFVVIERAQIDQILTEQDLGASGRVNPETAAEQGAVIGAAALISGGITEYSYTSSSLGGGLDVLKAIRVTRQELTAMVALDIRVLDAVTSEVLFSKRTEGEASSRSTSADVEIGDQEFSMAAAATTPLGQASRQAIEDAVQAIVTALADIPWTGRIIDVRGESVYVNAGSEDGIRTGMEFDVYEQEPPLIDPATGLNLGAPERYLGALRITDLEDRYSIAEVVTGQGFGRNHLLRISGQAPKR